MKERDAVLTGEHFLLGDHAIAEGALAAGCRFFAGYPITPSTETAERMAVRLPEIGGTYLQMEDEIASITAILGASWAGHKTMTATSGPGFSLMLENLGLGIITETPTVIVNVQRGGPSTGLPTLVAQSDMMQARWGSHGHYEIIALTPWNAQECFDLTLRAFNLAERYRTPVLVMADAEVGHLTEKVVVPPAEALEIWQRRRVGDGLAADPRDALVPPMPVVGVGQHVFFESLTHDDRGYPLMTPAGQAKLVKRLVEKIRADRFALYDVEERDTGSSEVIVLSYGISARIATRAVQLGRERGIRVGLMRLRTAWPFPEERVRAVSAKVRGFVVPEINLGQMVREVERVAVDRCRVALVPHAGGSLHDPEEILAAVVDVLEGRAPCRADLVDRDAAVPVGA